MSPASATSLMNSWVISSRRKTPSSSWGKLVSNLIIATLRPLGPPYSSHGHPLAVGHNHAYANAVSLRILDGESPDAIVGSLKAEREWTVSTSTLYRYIGLGFIPGVTLANLPYPRRKRKKRSLRRAPMPPPVSPLSSVPMRSILAPPSVIGRWSRSSASHRERASLSLS